MQSVIKFFGATLFTVSVTLSACQAKAPVEKPDATQQTALNKLHKNCSAALMGRASLKNLAELRKKKQNFTCDEMKDLCENNYASEMCKGTMTVASIENAFQKACRSSQSASASAACNKLTVCNLKGFTAPECAEAIAPYNR